MADADADPRDYLLQIFEDLGQTEIGRFQWQLRSLGKIKKAKLDNADRERTVDAIIGEYDEEEVPGVLRKILKKIHRNDLLKKLPKTGPGAGHTGNYIAFRSHIMSFPSGSIQKKQMI